MVLLPLPSWKVNIPTRERSERRERSPRPIDLGEHEDDDDGRVRSTYLANILDMVEKKDKADHQTNSSSTSNYNNHHPINLPAQPTEKDDHQGAGKKKMPNKPITVAVAAAAAAMKPVVKEELGSGKFYGHGIELLQNLSLLADTSVTTLLMDKPESSSRCNRGVEEEEDQGKKNMKRKTCDGGSCSSSAPEEEEKKKKNISDNEGMQPLLLPAWMIDKFHHMGAASGDHLLMLSKKTTGSDTIRNQNRLLLSESTVKSSRLMEPLTEEEHAEVKKPDGLKVLMVDEKGDQYNVFFKFLTSNNAYRIIGEWSDYVTNNMLLPHLHTLHLCFFRLQADPRKLRLGVVKTMTTTLHTGSNGKAEEEELLWQERLRGIAEDKWPMLDLHLPPPCDDEDFPLVTKEFSY